MKQSLKLSTASFRMLEILEEPEAKVVVGITIIAIAIAVAVYVVMKLRSSVYESVPDPGDHLSSFRDLYERGAISKGEFSKVKEGLNGALKEQLEPTPVETKSGIPIPANKLVKTLPKFVPDEESLEGDAELELETRNSQGAKESSLAEPTLPEFQVSQPDEGNTDEGDTDEGGTDEGGTDEVDTDGKE